jgi:hypothetical protein
MNLCDGENILLADSAEDIADKITTLYRDEILWKKLSESGIKFADNAWGANAAYSIFSKIINDLGVAVGKANYPIRLY